MIGIVAFFFLFLMCDAAVLWCIRKILNQFLMGSTNKRQNREIKRNITACEKLTMSYVGQYINKNEKEKRCYARYYLFYRIALVVVPVVLSVTTIMYAHGYRTNAFIIGICVIVVGLFVTGLETVGVPPLEWGKGWTPHKRKNYRKK